MQHWELERVGLSGKETGSGELVLLLHGFPAYHKTWDSYLGPLGARFRTVAVDMRGYFESSKPSGVSSYRMGEVVADLVALVKHLGHRKVRVVGHDWGGAVAWAMAAWYPELVEKVAVFNCPHPQALSYHLLKNPKQRKRSWYIFFFQLPWIPELLIRWKSEEFVKAAFATPGRVFSDDDLEDYRRALLKPGVLRASVNYYRAAGRETLTGGTEFPKIKCPSLLLWGEKDGALGKEVTDQMERYFESSLQKIYYPDLGHWTPEELGWAGAKQLLEFL